LADCFDAWYVRENVDPFLRERIMCIGVAKGEVDVLYWDDGNDW